jgi:hypothetical protein
MKSEVLRELGEFESAKALLERVATQDATEFVNLVKSLCDKRDTAVRLLR